MPIPPGNMGRPTDQTASRMLLLAAALSILGGCAKHEAPPELPPPKVLVMPAETMDVPIIKEWIGTTSGNVNTDVRARVTGYLLTQNYREGDFVKEGTLMFTIDPRPFQAALDAANAGVAKAQAKLSNNKVELARQAQLLKSGATSQRDYDNAQEQVQASEAELQAAQAQVVDAQLNLGWCKVTAPIDGVAGIAQAQVGDLVGTAQNPTLTVISTINPIRVYFQLSEDEYLKAAEIINRLQQDPSSAKKDKLELILSNGTVYPQRGQFLLVSRDVNTTTGTLQIGATFPNPQHILRPGQYARVRAEVDTLVNAVVVPQRAINEIQGLYQISLVDSDDTVSFKMVKVGPKYKGLWVITDGLEKGQTIIVEGFQKVQEGGKVVPEPYKPAPNESVSTAAAAEDSAAPAPAQAPKDKSDPGAAAPAPQSAPGAEK